MHNDINNIREIFVNQFKTKNFLIGTILFSLFAILLYADLPVSILLAIGMWRLYFSSKADYATIRFNKSLSFFNTCNVCAIIMLEANVVFWALQWMVAKDGTSPYLYILIINLICSPFFVIFILWIILGILVLKDRLKLKTLFLLNTVLSLALYICAILLLVRALPMIFTESVMIRKFIMMIFTLSGNMSFVFLGTNLLTTVIKGNLKNDTSDTF